MYSITRIETSETFENLRDDWERLAGLTEHPNVFSSFDWMYSWWRTFGDQYRLYILVMRGQGNSVGIAPLMITESRFLGRTRKVVRFIGTPEIDYGDFLGQDKAEITRQVVRYLRENSADWTDISLSQISERSGTVEPLRAALKSEGIPYRLIEIETCSSFVFEGDESERAKYDPRRDKGLKSSINYFKRNGGLELVELTDPGDISNELYGLFHCHVNRWRNTSSPSFFLQRRFCNFFETMTDRLAPRGRLSVLLLKHNGLTLAYQFNFTHNGTVYLYTLTHNVFHRRRAPGVVINYFARKHYVRAGFKELDFVRGGQAHKSRLTNRRYQNYKIRVYSSLLPRNITRWYDKGKTTALFQKLASSRLLTDFRDRLALHYHEQGIGGLLKKAISKLASFVVDLKVVCMFRFEGPAQVTVEARLPVEVKMLGPEHVDEIASFLGIQADSPRYRTLIERFEKDADCFASYYHGHIACMGWGVYHEDRNPVTGFSALPMRKQVLFSDGFTSPVLRGQKIRPHLMAYQLNYYQKKGLQCITAVYRQNQPSIRVVQSLHFKKIRSVRQLRILGINVLRPRAITLSNTEG